MTRTPEQIHMRLVEIIAVRPDVAFVLNDVITELLRAELLYPNWPFDCIHACAVLNEEAGELTKECNDFVYAENNDDAETALANMEGEAVQTTAMGLRFLLGLECVKERTNTSLGR